MEAVAILRRTHEAGLSIGSRDDKLLVHPAGLLTDELRELLRQHKPELLQFIADAHATTLALLEAGEQACDHWRDGPEAREQMRQDCLNTPLHLRANLLAHFKGTYGGEE